MTLADSTRTEIAGALSPLGLDKDDRREGPLWLWRGALSAHECATLKEAGCGAFDRSVLELLEEDRDRLGISLTGFSRGGDLLCNAGPHFLQVLDHLERGYTAILVRADRIEPLGSRSREILDLFVRDHGLPAESHRHFWTNLYLNQAPNPAALPYVHADRHLVIAVQLSGRKRWVFPSQGGLIVLEAGDVLAVSKGLRHGAVPEGQDLSAHLTIELSEDQRNAAW